MNTQRVISLTAESAQINSYVRHNKLQEQLMAAYMFGLPYHNNPDLDQCPNVRMWGTSESATGYQALLAGFSPVTVPVAVY
jgi:hypothetical protein